MVEGRGGTTFAPFLRVPLVFRASFRFGHLEFCDHKFARALDHTFGERAQGQMQKICHERLQSLKRNDILSTISVVLLVVLWKPACR